MRSLFRLILVVALVAVLLTAGAVLVAALVNRDRPTRSLAPDRLNAAEQARLAEFFRAREMLGDDVWPGWGAADIPVLVFNEAYAYLVGLGDPAHGWIAMPQNQPGGGAWQLVGEAIDGRPIHRQPLISADHSPEAFAVRVGDRWVASGPTMEWFRVDLGNRAYDELPPIVRLAFPYGLVVNQRVTGSDHYISLLAHESFHAWQGEMAPERLAEAERAAALENVYPWDDEANHDGWRAELNALASGVAAPPERAAEFAAEFLRLRAERRSAADLSDELIDYERQREWLEGPARYVELGLWREASGRSYRPSAAIIHDPEFQLYANYGYRLNREIHHIRSTADDVGDIRFYYSGFAQAALLDRLMPDWKERVMGPGVYLEDLLAEAVGW